MDWLTVRTSAPSSVPTDLSGDGTTNGADLGILLGNWTT